MAAQAVADQIQADIPLPGLDRLLKGGIFV
jgi:hypothetical protein